ncbi:MAG: RNA pseudouridine synthase [Gammaproteobacteria bacterium]|nr:RNA pseudouridine synthase [Gammaproteobacteria bacterium]MBL6999226.1 RNA pseudouridine synthase [Gammaproteobacteria bacterium]
MTQELLIEVHRPVLYKQQLALDLLQHYTELTRDELLLCFDNGAVWQETRGKPQRIYDPARVLSKGHKIHLYCNHSTLSPCPFVPVLVADLERFSIWNKPSGMLSQGSKWGDHWTLYRWIKQHHWPERETFITHRLDRFTQGLMIVAHDADTNKKLHRQFEGREIQKTYRAIVQGLLAIGEQQTLTAPVDEREAETQLQVLDQRPADKLSLLEIHPKTGRKHQIRIHLAGIAHPVVNDRNYGQPPFDGDLMLQASALEFAHPQDGTPLKLELAPRDLLKFS